MTKNKVEGGGDYTKQIKCIKCGRMRTVHASLPGILEGVSEYVCVECQGVYEKFGGKGDESDKGDKDSQVKKVA